ncbi:ABC transporter permease [Devosia psychrophila]|uniref:ABC transporter permease n=1 Tax=Devosia psychrophila TaxID=728005 RepID=A0A0F5PXY2_9HYPH|nr:ABC transporter permease [Devosia psychrophila]KKC33246.1 ABC transporter permease [Devosia psychrophila]SFC25635.1 peptide/nickel transport system permease protein [Devosia psychrophila]
MTNWTTLIAVSVVRLALVLVAVAVVAFALAKLSPVDPVNAYLGADIARVGPEQRELIAEKWGLDLPPQVQFGKWLGNLLGGDLGYSMTYNAPVADVLAARFKTSLPLMGLAWLLSGIFGFALGVVAGAFPGTWLDRSVRLYSYVLASAPTFWIAILLLMVFSVSLRWTPVCCAAPIGMLPGNVTTLQFLHHMILPLIALTVLGVAQIALHTRAKLVEIMQSDYALYARAQGASQLEIALLHGARNAALPAITVLFASLGELFGGSVLAEQVFAYPGLGSATVEAGTRGDVPLLLALALFLTVFVFIGNSIADLLYRVVDPRMHGEPAR